MGKLRVAMPTRCPGTFLVRQGLAPPGTFPNLCQRNTELGERIGPRGLLTEARLAIPERRQLSVTTVGHPMGSWAGNPLLFARG